MTLDVSVSEDRRALRVAIVASGAYWEGEQALTEASVWGEAALPSPRGIPGLLRGLALAELLLPAEARALLAQLPSPVRLCCDEEAALLPWERLALAQDHTPPVRLVSRGLTRCLRSSPPRAPPQIQLRLLLLADLAGALGASRAEGEELRALLAGHPRVEIHQKEQIGSEELIRSLSEGPRFDLLHFSGRATANRGLELSRGEIFSAEHLSRLDAARIPPVLFLNGCGTAELSPRPTLARSLLASGVCALVGTHGQIRASAAWRVSELVYRALAGGETLGAALTRARRWLATTEHWGTYVLYGDPDFRFPR